MLGRTYSLFAPSMSSSSPPLLSTSKCHLDIDRQAACPKMLIRADNIPHSTSRSPGRVTICMKQDHLEVSPSHCIAIMILYSGYMLQTFLVFAESSSSHHFS